jgi:TonB family protein
MRKLLFVLAFCPVLFAQTAPVTQPPKLLSSVPPEYSEEARKAHLQGTVILKVIVDEAGNVVNSVVIRGLGLGLDEKAIEAAQKSKFSPGYKDGKPVSYAAQVEIHFRLDQSQQSPAPNSPPVAGDLSQAPKLLHKVEPEYSEQAREAHQEGAVTLRITIDEAGNVINPVVIRGLGLGLDEKAIEAVQKWKFSPGYKDGKPVSYTAQVEINFRFAQSPQSPAPNSPPIAGDLSKSESSTNGSTWIKMRSPHFDIYTSGNEQRAQVVITYFEGIRTFFRTWLGVKRDDSRVDIVAFTSKAEFADHRPKEFAAAYYYGTPNQDYIVLGDITDPPQVMAHEYVHLLVRHAGLRLPPWLNEGFAEVYSAVQPAEAWALVGGDIPSRHDTLKKQPWVPLSTILNADERSPYYNESAKAAILYSEGWALTHMLALTPEYGQKFRDFVFSINNQLSSDGALTRTYHKSIASIESDLIAYVQEGNFRAVPVSINISGGGEPDEARVMKESEVKRLLANLPQPKRGKQ